jgi:hypothetical protein
LSSKDEWRNISTSLLPERLENTPSQQFCYLSEEHLVFERLRDKSICSLLPQNKMLPERIVAEGAFGKGFEDSIKFILDGLS